MSRRAWSSVTSLVAVMALAGCGGSPSAPDRAAAQSVVAAEAEVSRTRVRMSFNGVVPACDREVFTMTTVVDFRQHITRLGSEEWMRTQHTTFSAKGVGMTSGAKYIGRGTVNDTQVFAVLNDAAFTYTSVVRMRNIVQGSADNELVAVHTKWTVKPDSQIVVDLFDEKFECRG